MKIDMFAHIVPIRLQERLSEVAPDVARRNERSSGIFPGLLDLDERFRIMDMFDNYVQVLSYAVPPFEILGAPSVATDLARLTNDSLAELVSKHPDRFPRFIASLPMNDPDGLMMEARRAIKELGAAGVQVYSNIDGRPLVQPETLPLFELMATLDLPIWIHPVRLGNFPDYRREEKSHYETWWALGWPYESSAAMTHIVFSGLFDRYPNLKIITHHGGGIVPYLEGRLDAGYRHMGARNTSWDDAGKAAAEERGLPALKNPPIHYFHLFHADTALFGAKQATICGTKFFGPEKTVFATDMPYCAHDSAALVRWTIDILDSIDLTPAERQAIYEGNARRLMKLPGAVS